MSKSTVKEDKFRILIVDDVVANIDVLRQFLSAQGYRLSFANNGEKALKIIQRAKPDLILLDVMMPGISGFEVCRVLKSQKETQDIPIIFMTALSSVEDKIEGFEAGAVDYVTKPVREKEVLARIQTHLTLHELQQNLAIKNAELAKEISEKVAAEKALAEKTIYLDNILRSSSEYAIATTDLNFHITYYNPMAEELFGYTAAEVIGKTVQEIHIQENVAPERFEKAIENVRNVGEHRYHLITEKANGKSEHISSRVSGIYDIDNELIGFALFSHNVTEKVKAEKALRKSERELDYKFRELSAIFEAAAEGIIIIDANGVIESFNKAAEQMFGYAARDVIGYEADILIKENASINRQNFKRYLKSSRWHRNRIEIIGLRKDGVKFPFNLSINEFEALDKKKFVGIIHDLTESKKTETILREKNELIRKVFGRYLSDEIVTNLLETEKGLTLGGDRREITILTSDIRGFTMQATQLPPEQVIKIINLYLASMTEMIAAYQGTIDEFMGDGILVLFGAPTVREDDAERAVACAIAMQLAMDAVNEKIKVWGLSALEMGIAVNTGTVVVGNIGSEKRTKYGVIGSEVNLTYRIESYTVGGQIFISESTFQKVKHIIEVINKHEVAPKGVKNPINVYEISGIKGNYDLFIPKKEERFCALMETIVLKYKIIKGKHIRNEEFSGNLVKLSERTALIYCHSKEDFIPEPLSNIKLNFFMPDRSEDIYAKVSSKPSEKQSFYIHFTAISPDVKRQIEKLCIKA